MNEWYVGDTESKEGVLYPSTLIQSPLSFTSFHRNTSEVDLVSVYRRPHED